jgi:hypothetical protein
MKKSLCVLLLVAACDSFPSADDCEDNPAGRHHGINPATGACWEFDSSCDVPAGWAECEGDPGPDASVPPADGGGEPPPDGGMPPADGPMCTGGAYCIYDSECPDGQWCNGGIPGVPCDPSSPACDVPAPPAGICTCGTRPGDSCSKTIECGLGELCPAEYGGPGMCETACFGDFDCASGERCNAPDLIPYCPQPNWKRTPRLLIACAGWCVPIAP